MLSLEGGSASARLGEGAGEVKNCGATCRHFRELKQGRQGPAGTGLVLPFSCVTAEKKCTREGKGRGRQNEEGTMMSLIFCP